MKLRLQASARVLSWRTFGAAYFAPLWVHEPLTDTWLPNLRDGMLEAFSSAGIDTDAEGVMYYAYAILNSPSYRERYRDALRYDFARLPFTADAELFATVRDLGRELALAHLLEHPSRDSELPAMEGDDEAVLEAPRYEPETKTLYLAETLLARPVEGDAWRYQQGAYRVLRDYVEARRERQLSSEEFVQFRELAAAVRLTLNLLPKVDALMPAVIANTFAANALGFPDDNGAPDR